MSLRKLQSHIDAPLISAFGERWQPETSSFHLLFGEMTIMMHDVWHILHIPVDGFMVYDTTSFGALRGLVVDSIGRTVAHLGSPFWEKWCYFGTKDC